MIVVNDRGEKGEKPFAAEEEIFSSERCVSLLELTSAPVRRNAVCCHGSSPQPQSRAMAIRQLIETIMAGMFLRFKPTDQFERELVKI